MGRFYDELEKRFGDVISEEEVCLHRHIYIVSYKEGLGLSSNVVPVWVVAYSERDAIDKLMEENDTLEISDIVAVSVV